MTEMREARDGELQGTAGQGQFRLVAVEDGELKGCVSCSILPGANGEPVAWLHDIEYWGTDASVSARLMVRAFQWIKAKGHTQYLANVSAKALNVIAMCVERGELYQLVFKMEIPRHAH